jgi:hypothetical protein
MQVSQLVTCLVCNMIMLHILPPVIHSTSRGLDDLNSDYNGKFLVTGKTVTFIHSFIHPSGPEEDVYHNALV